MGGCQQSIAKFLVLCQESWQRPQPLTLFNILWATNYKPAGTKREKWMNNAKVRIYDLSKELKLENKDILAVCEDLNIAVKSHSSTISESDAERIRNQAAKYVANHPSPKRGGHNSQSGTAGKHRDNAQASEAGSRPIRKSQQILEVRQVQTRPVSQVKQQGEGNVDKSQTLVAVPPGSPVNQQNPVNNKPTLPNRPVPQKPSHTNSEEKISGPMSQETAQTGGREKPVQNQGAQHSQPGQERSKSEAKPHLIGPPSRPAPPQGNRSGNAGGSRPILKKAKQEQAGKEAPVGGKEAPQRTENPNRAEGTPGKKQRNRDRDRHHHHSGEGNKPQPPTTVAAPTLDPLRPKPVLKLDRESAAAEIAPIPNRSRIIEEDATTENEEDLLILNRPTPPRPPKKTKKREEEEDDMSELSEKGLKAGKGTKRRTKLTIDEDDEDFESELEEIAPTIQVSLSVARPARPKGISTKAVPTAIMPNKGQKGSANKDNSKAARRDRREQAEKEERPENIIITGPLTVRELANELVVPETEIVKKLFFKGMMVQITQTLDIPTIIMVAEELGVTVETAERESEAIKTTEMIDAEDLENLQSRPPVVTIMGHVDHGKTTLLDSIRKTKVAQGEAGGITQHIGAYHVDVSTDSKTQQVVFLDTPGHEAFTAMRARGARVTDIAILVVAADDGVQPQTIEAISHAKAAEVPIIVAINKVDKEDANPDRVKQELMEHGLVPEEWGGDTIMVPVSALKGENLDNLLEMILLVAEIEQLSANPDRPAKGTVIEANLDKSRGPVATLLLQNGTLHVGDILVAGSAMGKVRAMIDDRGQRVEAATPSFAVEVLGLGDVPAAGDEFEVFQNEKEARALAESRAEQQRQSRLLQGRISLSTLSARAQEGQLKELNLILKGDVQGSVEAIIAALRQLPQNEVQLRVLLGAPGEVTETDIDLAAASDAVIIGFNTTLAPGARQAADQAGVDVREYNIIYTLLDDIQGAMEGLLEPELVEEPLGQVEVRAVFPASKGSVAGCYVLSGKIIRNCKVRVRRHGNVIYENNLDSLRRMRDDVKEVNAGYECGIGLDGFHDWMQGDIIESFRMVTKRRTLSQN